MVNEKSESLKDLLKSKVIMKIVFINTFISEINSKTYLQNCQKGKTFPWSAIKSNEFVSIKVILHDQGNISKQLCNISAFSKIHLNN